MRTPARPITNLTRRLSATALLAALLLTIGGVFWAWSADVSAESATVTLKITRVVEVNCDEEVGESCPNDYYPKVDVGATGTLDDGKARFCCAHGTDVQMNDWIFTRTIDTSQRYVPIIVELHDQDDASDDEHLDISPVAEKSLIITLDLNSCTWQGQGLRGAVETQASSQGTEEDAAKVYFVVSTSASACGDSDGDGLLNAWESNGYDDDGDGTIDVNLPAMGARPDRKDLFLELDYMNASDHTHAPTQNAIRTVVQAFANAAVPNGDGTVGIQLHIDVGPLFGSGFTQVAGSNGVTGTFGDHGGGGNVIAENGNTIIDWDGPVGRAGTNFFTLKNMNANRNNIFRYTIFAHQTNSRRATNDCTSGEAFGIPGTNFFVTLGGLRANGNPCWTADAGGQSVGSDNEQAGTLMHEFGHVIGLQHGGVDGVNNKPNYLSVMNYSFQSCAVPSSPSLFATPAVPGACDFSRHLLPNPVGLNETNLDECRGIDSGALGFGAVDWNGNSTLEGSTCTAPNSGNVQVNINGDFVDANGNSRQDSGEASTIGTLKGFEDWSAIVYNHRMVFDFTVAGTPSPDEPDSETIERSREMLTETLRPALSVDATGPALARPGDTIAYNIGLGNSGRGPALYVSFVDTLPDATTVTTAIGTVQVKTSTSRSVSYGISCSTADGTVLTNAVAATGIDLLSNALSVNDSVQTTVQAPKLTLTKSATATVNAGEAITYTIEYANTGSGAATQVAIVDTLPAGIYYSAALDTGTDGPRPTSVTLNADGTRTLRWTLGTVAGSSGPERITFTARPTLLARSGATYTNQATLSFTNANGCTYDALNATAATAITEVPATLDPLTVGYWKTHPEEWQAEILARIQATDARFDRLSPTGALSAQEVSAAFAPSGMPHTLEQQLLATYFNLATRRLNAGTAIDSRLATRLGLADVGAAAEHGMATLALPLSKATADRYSNATGVLDEINSGRAIR